jgi:hypothetical protein
MSMLKTLAKVAIGVMVVRGVSGMMEKGGEPANTPTPPAKPTIDDILKRRRGDGEQKAGSGTVFGGPYSPNRKTESQGGSLEDILGGILGGGSKPDAPKRGGLGGALDELSDLSTPGQGGAAPLPGSTDTGSFGEALNQSFDKFGEPDAASAPEHEDLARLLLRAMLQAAKSDGKIDSSEKKALLDQLGQATREEMDFVQAELDKPVDIEGLVGDTPRGS